MTIRGIDHVGVTVSSIEQATEFFVRALGAQVLYDTLPREDGSRGGEATDQRLGVPGGTDEIAIRMLRLPCGPVSGTPRSRVTSSGSTWPSTPTTSTPPPRRSWRPEAPS